jgi:hypothetical protein
MIPIDALSCGNLLIYLPDDCPRNHVRREGERAANEASYEPRNDIQEERLFVHKLQLDARQSLGCVLE